MNSRLSSLKVLIAYARLPYVIVYLCLQDEIHIHTE